MRIGDQHHSLTISKNDPDDPYAGVTVKVHMDTYTDLACFQGMNSALHLCGENLLANLDGFKDFTINKVEIDLTTDSYIRLEREVLGGIQLTYRICYWSQEDMAALSGVIHVDGEYNYQLIEHLTSLVLAL